MRSALRLSPSVAVLNCCSENADPRQAREIGALVLDTKPFDVYAPLSTESEVATAECLIDQRVAFCAVLPASRMNFERKFKNRALLERVRACLDKCSAIHEYPQKPGATDNQLTNRFTVGFASLSAMSREAEIATADWSTREVRHRDPYDFSAEEILFANGTELQGDFGRHFWACLWLGQTKEGPETIQFEAANERQN